MTQELQRCTLSVRATKLVLKYLLGDTHPLPEALISNIPHTAGDLWTVALLNLDGLLSLGVIYNNDIGVRTEEV